MIGKFLAFTVLLKSIPLVFNAAVTYLHPSGWRVSS
jgi:hypothetical protein